MEGISRLADIKTLLSPLSEVEISSLSSISSAVGPIMGLPSAVFIIRTPFDTLEGIGKIRRLARSAFFLSRINSSPLRGLILKSFMPSIPDISSAKRPAAFTRYLDLNSPGEVFISKYLSARLISMTSALVKIPTPFLTAFSARSYANR